MSQDQPRREPAAPPSRTRSGRLRAVRATSRWAAAVGLVAVAAAGWWAFRQYRPKARGAPPEPPRPVADQVADRGSLQYRALLLADRLLREFPENADALYVRGLILARWLYRAEAVRCWQRSLELAPDHAGAYTQLGYDAFRLGEFQKAASLLCKAVQLNPNSSEGTLWLGESLLEGGQTEEAVSVLQEHVAHWPDSAPGWLRLGEACLRQGDYPKAKTCFKKLLNLEPEFARGYFGMMTACARLGEHQEAKRYEARFQELRKTDRAMALRRKREYGEESVHRRNFAETCTLAGNFYLSQRMVRQAEDCWQTAAAADPTDTESRRLLARSLIQRGDYRAALPLAEELQRLQPEAVDFWLNGGRLHAQLQQFDAAERCLRKALELAPRRAEVRATLAQLYLQAGRNLPEAENLARSAVQLEANPRFYAVLSEACAANGHRQEALAAIQQAAELDPGNPAYRELLQRLRQGQ